MKKKKGTYGRGSIYESNGYRIGQYYIEGKKYKIYQKKNETTRQFEKRFTNIVNSVEDGTYIQKTNDTLRIVLERYINQRYKDGFTSPRTYKRNKETLSQLANTCNNIIDKPIQKIKEEDIEDCKDNMRKYAQNSINKIWLLLNKGFELATQRRKVPYNIMLNGIEKPLSLKQTKVVEALTVDDEKTLRYILKTFYKDNIYAKACLLQLNTGMRMGEVLARTFDDVDFEHRTINIHNTITEDENYKTILGEHTKTYNKSSKIDKGARIIPLDNETLNIIKDLQKMKNKNIGNFIFWNYRTNSFLDVSNINSWLSRVNNKYKITKNLSTHKLRHTRITRLQEQNIALPVIQYMVGHTQGSKITNDIYTSISLDFINNELNKIKA